MSTSNRYPHRFVLRPTNFTGGVFESNSTDTALAIVRSGGDIVADRDRAVNVTIKPSLFGTLKRPLTGFRQQWHVREQEFRAGREPAWAIINDTVVSVPLSTLHQHIKEKVTPFKAGEYDERIRKGWPKRTLRDKRPSRPITFAFEE